MVDFVLYKLRMCECVNLGLLGVVLSSRGNTIMLVAGSVLVLRVGNQEMEQRTI